MRTIRWWLPAAASLALLAGCSDAGEPVGPREDPDPLVALLVERGADPEHIVDRGEYFVVEGDIRVYKRDLREPLRDGGGSPGGPRYQQYVGTVAGGARLVRVDLSAVDAEDSSWAAATRAAMSNWTSITGTNVTFVEQSPADITISFVNSISGTCVAAESSWPSGGAPGPTVVINRSYKTSYDYGQQVYIMTHELGHNLGLAHTDQSFGSLVPGTPTSDPGSVMNSGGIFGSACPIALTGWTWFSSYDVTAMRTLYPLPSPSASLAYPSGTPTASWSALVGASSYRLYRVTEQYFVGTGTYATDTELVTITTSTSAADPARAYTGEEMCEIRGTHQGGVEERYYYRVEGFFEGWTTSHTVPAAIGDC